MAAATRAPRSAPATKAADAVCIRLPATAREAPWPAAVTTAGGERAGMWAAARAMMNTASDPRPGRGPGAPDSQRPTGRRLS